MDDQGRQAAENFLRALQQLAEAREHLAAAGVILTALLADKGAAVSDDLRCPVGFRGARCVLSVGHADAHRMTVAIGALLAGGGRP